MKRNCTRAVAAMVGLATLMTPITALADEAGDYCSTYAQVESKATGGDYVGGLLMYETMATVQRQDDEVTVTTTVTTNGQVGVPGSGAGGSTSTTVTTSTQGTVTTAQEPVGYYSMNDGSVYQINCVTGENRKVSN